MVIMGGKDGTKAVRDLNVVNIGTAEEPVWALAVDVSDLATEATLQSIKDEMKPLTLKESFDESNLENGAYIPTKTYTKDLIGFGIINNNEDDPLTFIIETITLSVPPGKQFYAIFDRPISLIIAVAGENLDFDAFVEG